MLQSMGWQRVRHDMVTKQQTICCQGVSGVYLSTQRNNRQVTKTRLLSAPVLTGPFTPLQTEPSDKRCSAGPFGCCCSQVCKKDPGSTQARLLQGSLTWVLVDTYFFLDLTVPREAGLPFPWFSYRCGGECGWTHLAVSVTPSRQVKTVWELCL